MAMVATYRRPGTLDEALGLLTQPGAVVLAGGTRLNGEPSRDQVVMVDLQDLRLSGVERLDGGALRIGAMTTLQQIVENGDVPFALRDAAGRLEPNTIRAGDAIVGLPSSGVHTNGYSLVRKVFEDVPLSKVYSEIGRPLGDELLEPHRSYLEALTTMRWKGAAHITGGGILGNLPRCLPEGLGARLERKSWTEPPIFGLLRKRGKVSDDEMLGTFNMGLGMILVMDGSDVPPGAQVVGEVVRRSGPDRVMIR